MGRKKHIRINEAAKLENVFSAKHKIADKMLRDYFQNNSMISLEIGCGHGDYTIQLAKSFPDKNFIGVDYKSARIWVGAKYALENKLNNAAFLNCRAELLSEIFTSEKIEEIFITFPEPHVRRTSERRRLVAPEFLKIYKQILIPGGRINLKTDCDFLYDYSNKIIIKENLFVYLNEEDLYNSSLVHPLHKGIQTKYERHYLGEGRKIKYISFGFKS